MITVITLLKLKPSPNGEQHGERAFWRAEGKRYLDAWLATVRRYVPEPKQVIVMTDAIESAAPALQDGEWCVDLDAAVDAPGFWAKLEMFRHGIGKSLYIDLDNCINGDLSALCALTPDPLIMLDDRRVPRLPNGSVMLFDAERCRFLWDVYRHDPKQWQRRHAGPKGDDYSLAYDQAFINMRVTVNYRAPLLFQDLLPPGYILNSRSELPNASDWRSARVIFGGGMEKEGKPHTATHPAFSLDESRLGGW